MTTYGPFQVDHWWDGHARRYNCAIHLGRMAVVEHDSYEAGPIPAELRAWRAMAKRLAQQRDIPQGHQ